MHGSLFVQCASGNLWTIRSPIGPIRSQRVLAVLVRDQTPNTTSTVLTFRLRYTRIPSRSRYSSFQLTNRPPSMSPPIEVFLTTIVSSPALRQRQGNPVHDTPSPTLALIMRTISTVVYQSCPLWFPPISASLTVRQRCRVYSASVAGQEDTLHKLRSSVGRGCEEAVEEKGTVV